MSQTEEIKNKELVLKAFDTLFNKRDVEAAGHFWSSKYIQHSAHIPPGREGLFELIKNAPSTLRYENQLTIANGDYVMLHGRFSGHGGGVPNWIVVDIVRVENGKLAEHWDVIEDEVTREQSKSGLPMFGTSFIGERGLVEADCYSRASREAREWA
jgi:predicted SnoaL-like aldol condensation-catalyzing enzyme